MSSKLCPWTHWVWSLWRRLLNLRADLLSARWSGLVELVVRIHGHFNLRRISTSAGEIPADVFEFGVAEWTVFYRTFYLAFWTVELKSSPWTEIWLRVCRWYHRQFNPRQAAWRLRSLGELCGLHFQNTKYFFKPDRSAWLHHCVIRL